MGDVKYDHKSRMGLTLQGYDQVVALSQANINQSLKRHFNIDEKGLKNFQAVLGKNKDKPTHYLKGKIDAPTIQLVDADKADGALYTIKFLKGSEYMYWCLVDEEDPGAGVEQKKLSAEGWVLAFYVNFSMKTAATLPQEIKDVVMKTNSYSVDQLVVVFGAAHLLTFDSEHTKLPSLENNKTGLLSARTKLKDFVDMWLTDLRNKDPTESHNILGYTVKLDVKDDKAREQLEKRTAASSPSFPPTAVQFQTIAYKTDRLAQGDKTHPYNAFLFTEMTDIKRPLPSHDLQWSGNWFYGSIGGTMAMSGGVFFRDFVGPLVEPVHEACTKFAEPLAKRQTWDAEARIPRQRSDKKFLNTWTHGQWLRSGTNQWVLESTAQGEHHDLPWYDSGKDFLVMVNIDVKMTSWLVPYPATGKFDIQQRITVVTKWVNHSEKYTFDATSTFNWNYAVTLAAVGSGGELTSSVVYTTNDKPELTASITVNGIRIRGIGSTQTEEERKKWANYEEELKSTIVNRMGKTDNFTKNINEGLNGQKKFIFPGGGTFDMSDPIFSEAGDLLLGLVYRAGKL